MTDTVREPARDIPVTHAVDLVVAGGGTAGVAAAVSAARAGLSVVMVERTAIPGGMITHVTQWLNDFANKGGFAREFLAHLRRSGICDWPNYDPFRVTPYLDDLLADAGVRCLYLCQVASPAIEDGRVSGVIVESTQGRHAIRAGAVIDASGDGHVAAGAGAKVRLGRDADGATQAISLSHLWMNYGGAEMSREQFADTVARAAAAGGSKLSLLYDRWRLRKLIGSTTTVLNGSPHVVGFDPTSAEGLSDALTALRSQAREVFDLLKTYADGFDGIEFGPFSALPGVREGRRIVCDKTIAAADTAAGRRHDDGLFLVTQAIDIHCPTGDDPPIVVREVEPYHVPYGAMLPGGVEGLIAAGRCISGEHESLASYRVIADCLAMGEAAAVAAQFAIDNGCTPRQVDGRRVAEQMAKRGYQQ